MTMKAALCHKMKTKSSFSLSFVLHLVPVNGEPLLKITGREESEVKVLIPLSMSLWGSFAMGAFLKASLNFTEHGFLF